MNRDRILHEGDEFIVSCLAQGSTTMEFRWFKDGIPVNESVALRWVCRRQKRAGGISTWKRFWLNFLYTKPNWKILNLNAIRKHKLWEIFEGLFWDFDVRPEKPFWSDRRRLTHCLIPKEAFERGSISCLLNAFLFMVMLPAQHICCASCIIFVFHFLQSIVYLCSIGSLTSCNKKLTTPME